MSSVTIMNIARAALLSNQTAINVTGANIANAETPGYTRQLPVFNSVAVTSAGIGQFQTGVEIQTIERIYDQFLDVQINAEINDFNFTEVTSEEFEKVEIIFNETGDNGIDALMNQFWAAWEDLSLNPTGEAERFAIISVAESMTDTFHSQGTDLLNLQEAMNLKIDDLINQTNDYIDAIADLNEKIMQNMSDQGGANDLLDKRMEYINKLEAIINCTYIEDSIGSMSIFLPDGTSLVDGNEGVHLEASVNAGNSFFYDVAIEGSTEGSINDILSSGMIGGLLEMRDAVIGGEKGYLSRLNDFVTALVQEVNAIHRAGYDAVHNRGEDFFECSESQGNENAQWLLGIEVNDEILSDIDKIAASATVNADGENALRMGALKDQSVTVWGGGATLNSHYASFVGMVGEDVANAERVYDHHNSLMNQLMNTREKISGVSIDEEMISLIKYQTGYNAAARLCTVAGELIDTVLNLGQ